MYIPENPDSPMSLLPNTVTTSTKKATESIIRRSSIVAYQMVFDPLDPAKLDNKPVKYLPEPKSVNHPNALVGVSIKTDPVVPNSCLDATK